MANPQKLPKLPDGVSEACLELIEEPINFHPAVAKLCGSANAGLMCSQGLYWSRMPNVQQKGGWFYKTSVEWQEETCLTRREQDTARKVLVEKGFMETKLEKVNGAPTLHFRMHWDAILAAHLKAHNVQMESTEAPNGLHENAKSESTEAPNGLHENAKSESTEAPNPSTKTPNPIRKQENSHTTTQENSKTLSGSQSSPAVSPPKGEPDKPASDPRFQPAVDCMYVCWPPGCQFIFDSTDGAYLNRTLLTGKLRNLPLDEIFTLIGCRFCSDPEGTNLTESPRRWIPSLHEYGSGPRNKFGKPKFSGEQLAQMRQQILERIKRKLAQPRAEQIPLGDPPAISVPGDFQATAGIQLWASILETASRKTNRNGFEQWLRPTKGFGIWRGLLFVRVPSPESKLHLAKLDAIFKTEIDGSPVKGITFMTQEEFESFEFKAVHT